MLLLPPSGTDLSASTGRRLFFGAHGFTPVDLSWYGGTAQLGYSLLSQAVMDALGVRPAGVLAALVSAVVLGLLLEGAHARRPVLGALVGAVGLVGNIASGRVTYGLGLALGLLALLAVQRQRPWLVLPLALLAGATSPVAGLFAGLAGAALLVTGRRRDGLLLGVGAAAPLLVVGVLFGQGGTNTMSRQDALSALVLAVVVGLAVRVPVVRAGAALTAAGLLLAYNVHTPVGANATRITAVFALPLLLALSPWRLRTLAVAVLLLALPQRPVLLDDLRGAGDPVTRAATYAPLVDELRQRAPAERVEVVPTEAYWESVHVAAAVPLARGWLRQLDTRDNPLFFDDTLDAETYRAWLADVGVAHVALHDGELSWVGQREGDLVRAGLPYLTEVWRGGGWTLYEVAGRPQLADGAEVVTADAASVRLRTDGPGDVLVRVQWSRWLTLTGPGCLEPAGRWTRVRAGGAGELRLGSALQVHQADRC